MKGRIRAMVGTGIAADAREAASALRWWLEMGVDVAIQEDARNWLADDKAAPALLAPEKPAAPAELPDTLEAFHHWLSNDASAPLFAPRSKAVMPHGDSEPEIMILAEPPRREDIASGTPLSGEAKNLLQAMLRAIGMAGQAYVANLACFLAPVSRMSPQQVAQCAEAARRHVALVKPKRLLLLGDAPCVALLDKTVADARGHTHRIEGVPAVATFHPRQLIIRTGDKGRAWQDLLLLTKDSQ
ncbi:uracil-DNA glycosylase [Sphingomonas sabuli]|uniref:Uracil-DNA glycosylase n=1 Tax=Sphingomonas sabuli TaxID=2764186 RepID=A0A7G9L447_9SPHN|nr:uracil-DNA glycosylase [Sphingomonas sabuli]QNM83396.1 uracil-DNA glycosylase [Sphingomonas sabuli]